MVLVAVVDGAGHAPRTYGNWRRPTSPGLLGLGSVGTAVLLGGMIFVVITVMVAGLFEALAAAAVLGLFLLLLISKDSHGRSLLSRATTRVGWRVTRARGSHLYRSGPLGRALWGTFQLPGLLAASRLSEHTDSYGRPFALLHVPATAHFTVVLGTEPDGASLVDETQIDLWVSSWGHWLATLADEPGLDAASVTIETAPDTGSRLRREVSLNVDPNAPAFARAMLDEVVQRYPIGSSTVRAFVALTFNAASRAGGRKRSAEEMGRELAARLPGLTLSLQATGAGAAHPVTAQELCEIVRVAYDPAAGTLIDEAHAVGQVPDLSWDDVGPSAHEATWASYRHDSAVSMTWAMSGAPQGLVQAKMMGNLLAPHRDIARKRVTLLYRPIDPARAAAIVEADLRAAEFRQTSSAKPAARDVLAVRSAAATASEEAAGAGLVNFGLLITASVVDPADEADARAAVSYMASAARVRLRPVHGAQDSAFAAALPLGLVLPKHLKVPAELRNKL